MVANNCSNSCSGDPTLSSLDDLTDSGSQSLFNDIVLRVKFQQELWRDFFQAIVIVYISVYFPTFMELEIALFNLIYF